MEERILAIIPARDGSKRLKNKNIRHFCGEPIIKYSIDIAHQSRIFDEIMVSTESRKIASIAKSYGAKVPFMRSLPNASDHATVADVILEVLSEYEKRGVKFKYFCCIFATAPLVQIKNLKIALSALKKKEADSVLPVIEFEYPIQRALKIEKGWIKMMDPKQVNVRSQDLEMAYHDSAKFYFASVEKFKKYKTFFMPNAKPIIIAKTLAQVLMTKKILKLQSLNMLCDIQSLIG